MTAAALVLALVGIGGFWLANRNSDTPGIDTTPAPAGPPSTMQPVPPGTSAPTNPPTMPPGEEARLDCSGGNGSFTRRWQPELSSAGIVYDAVPDWTFSFDGSYWTWLDDHTSLGDVHLDDAKNEAGITIGGLPYAAGFADQATAGERTVECLEGSLSTEERATAGTPVTVETTLGGMKTFHTRVEITDSNPKPLLVDIYVIDAAQGSKWAQVITFQRPDSSAKPLIEKAVASVRHV
ncbi:MAG: hypothetical protein Q4G46_11965 [Propionibacteriaceae bacterium]|nr:hypothetical protein [Propionibacteriaceae bacterium]